MADELLGIPLHPGGRPPIEGFKFDSRPPKPIAVHPFSLRGTTEVWHMHEFEADWAIADPAGMVLLRLPATLERSQIGDVIEALIEARKHGHRRGYLAMQTELRKLIGAVSYQETQPVRFGSGGIDHGGAHQRHAPLGAGGDS